MGQFSMEISGHAGSVLSGNHILAKKGKAAQLILGDFKNLRWFNAQTAMPAFYDRRLTAMNAAKGVPPTYAVPALITNDAAPKERGDLAVRRA